VLAGLPDAADGSLRIHQDAPVGALLTARLDILSLRTQDDLHVAPAACRLTGMSCGDALMHVDEAQVTRGSAGSVAV
jgi:hypothetical protein